MPLHHRRPARSKTPEELAHDKVIQDKAKREHAKRRVAATNFLVALESVPNAPAGEGRFAAFKAARTRLIQQHAGVLDDELAGHLQTIDDEIATAGTLSPVASKQFHEAAGAMMAALRERYGLPVPPSVKSNNDTTNEEVNTNGKRNRRRKSD